MSTRGAIARPTPDGGWQGRYHHFDAYPTGLGRELFGLYHHTFDRDHEQMTRALIDEHPAGWSTLIARNLGGRVFTGEDFARSGFQALDDPHHGMLPQCYCHGQRSERAPMLVCRCDASHAGPACDPAFIEWVYAIDAEGLRVFASVRSPHHDGGYVHQHIARVPWDREPAPPWQAYEWRVRLRNTPGR